MDKRMQRDYARDVETQEVQVRVCLRLPLHPNDHHASLHCHLLGVWRCAAHARQRLRSVPCLWCPHCGPRLHDYSPGMIFSHGAPHLSLQYPIFDYR